MKKVINLTAEGLAVVLGIIGFVAMMIGMWTVDFMVLSWAVGFMLVAAYIVDDDEFDR